MPPLQNKELVGRILRSTIGVISRRTSEAYANIVVANTIKDIEEKYNFLQYIRINENRFDEIFDIIEIDDEINDFDIKEVGKAVLEFMKKITDTMGKSAGYYFLREIKEDLTYNYELTLKEIGLDLDYLQLNFITKMKQSSKFDIKNSEILKHIITIIFEVLDKDNGRIYAYKTLNDIIRRVSIEHNVLNYVKINDISTIQQIDIVTIDKKVDDVESSKLGAGIQKIIQEINNNLGDKDGILFIEKIKDTINPDFNYKIREIGIDLSVIKLNQMLVVKHVLKSLVEVLSESSTESYAVLMVNNLVKKFQEKYTFFNGIKINSIMFTQGEDGIDVPITINDVRASELGRSIQRFIENLTSSLGEEAGRFFIEKFRKCLGKAYIIRIEEIGVNLHMIELKQNFIW